MDNLLSKTTGDSGLYWDVEVTLEEQEEMIQKIAQTIHKYGMDVAAILMIESFTPLTFIGAQMGRLFLSPFFPALGDGIEMKGEQFLQILEKRENVRKLLQYIEILAQEGEEKKKAEKAKKIEEKKAKMAEGEEPEKKGWRRFLPF